MFITFSITNVAFLGNDENTPPAFPGPTKATTDDVLDGERLRLVDLLRGVGFTPQLLSVSQCTLLLPKPSERSSAPEVLGLVLVVPGMQSESLAAL